MNAAAELTGVAPPGAAAGPPGPDLGRQGVHDHHVWCTSCTYTAHVPQTAIMKAEVR